METSQFIKKYKLTEKDVPRLYKVYLDLVTKDIDQAMRLTTVINALDINKTVNY